jgi:hypothetical protein
MRFRFTIRDLLWLTLVVAMGVGWWVSYRSYSAPPRFQVSFEDTHEDKDMYLTDRQTGEVWVKTHDAAGTRWYRTSPMPAQGTPAARRPFADPTPAGS